jgi:hypothetical protein
MNDVSLSLSKADIEPQRPEDKKEHKVENIEQPTTINEQLFKKI